jgi:putative Flp pilus-assembly TadE/G-like protein
MLPSTHVARRSRQHGRGLPGGGRARERGAVVVHVAVAMFGLLAFSALTIDLGTMWVARGEAQNVADAAALSGAVSMLGVDMSTEDGRTAVRQAAEAVATQHRIWGEPVDVGRSVQVTAGAGVCPGVAEDCVNVVICRTPACGAPLPVFFSRLFGMTANGVRAYASARAAAGNATGCPSPVAIPDRWVDSLSNPIDRDADHWPDNPVFDLGVDAYQSPGPTGTGTSYTRDMIGVRSYDWRRHYLQNASEPLGMLEFLSLDLREPGSAVPDIVQYRTNVLSCSGVPLRIGDQVPIFFGGREEIRQPFEELYDMDPRARWDGSQIVDSAFPRTPRVLTVAVFDPEDFVRQRLSGVARPQVTIRNFVGVFVEAQTEHPLPGRLVPTSGSFDGGADTVDARAAFLRSIALVR